MALDLGFAGNHSAYTAPRVFTEVVDQLPKFIVLSKATLVDQFAGIIENLPLVQSI